MELQLVGTLLLAVIISLPAVLSQPFGACTAQTSTFEIDGFSATFNTYCGYDIPGYDFENGRQSADSFSSCQTQCVEKHPLCYAFSYEATALHGSQNCYLKRSAVPSSAVTLQSYQMDSAILDLSSVQATDDCQSLSPRRATASSVYNIFCGLDISGGDLLSIPALSMSDCITKCDKNHDCEAIAYEASQLHGLKNCYLKKAGYPDPTTQPFAIAAATRASSQLSTTTATTQSRATANFLSPMSSTTTVTAVASSSASPTASGNPNSAPIHSANIGLLAAVANIALTALVSLE